MSAATLADPERGAKIAAGIPVGRPATVREIAGPVLFLCTPLAGFISGEILNVNGGAGVGGVSQPVGRLSIGELAPLMRSGGLASWSAALEEND